MTDLKLHTKETAPQKSAELLAGVEEKYGFIPNLMSVFAESPLDDPFAARLSVCVCITRIRVVLNFDAIERIVKLAMRLQ